MASEENPNLCIYVLSINEQPEPISITPLTWAKLQQLQLRTWASKERLWSKAQSVEDLCSCAVLSITCSGSVCLSSLQGNCSASWLSLSHYPAHSPSAWEAFPLFPGAAALEGPVMGSWSQRAQLKLHPQLQVQLPPVQAHSFLWRAGTAAQLRLTGAALCSSHHSNQRDKDKVAKGHWEGSPAPLSCFLAAPQHLFSPLWDSPGFTSATPSAAPPFSHCTPGTVPLWGSHSIPFSSSLLWPFTSQAAGFFKAYILEIVTGSNY